MIKTKEVISFAFRHPDTGKVNQPQCTFHDLVMKAVGKLINKRFFFYGGAIRGGKTFVCLWILVQLARAFPNSRWHIIRSTFTELEDTTIPSMEKLIGTQGKDFVWKRNRSNFRIVFSNGSKIFFKSERLSDDENLTWMLGLETNGIFLEQMEGLSEKLFSMAITRLGSWYIEPMPIPLMLGTFNPTDTWVKKFIYDRWIEEELPETWHFEEALPDDNPYVTPEQWENWKNLDPLSLDQSIKGIWRFENDAKLFAYAFNRKKNIIDVEKPEGAKLMQPNPRLPMKIIFDFNVDPITAIAAQNYGLEWGKIYKEYRLRNSDIFELCTRIRSDWKDYYLIVSGDASARARDANTKGARTYAQTIFKLLRLNMQQIKFPKKNPSVKNTRVLLNSMLFNHKNFFISSACQWLIADLEGVKVDEHGNMDKTKDAHKTHLLDTLRYFLWDNFRRFIFKDLDNEVDEAA